MSKNKAPVKQDTKAVAAPTKNRPKNKLGWTHAAFRHLSAEQRNEIRTKEQAVTMARILKMERKVANEMQYLPKDERAVMAAEQQKKRDQRMVEQYKHQKQARPDGKAKTNAKGKLPAKKS